MSANSRKRKLEEYQLSTLPEVCEHASVHGVVTDLSPVKTSAKNSKRQYFQAQVSDGTKRIKVVSFQPSLRSAMDLSLKDCTPIEIKDCKIEKGSDQEDSHIFLTHQTQLANSPRKFTIPEHMKESKIVQISDLPTLADRDKVTVTVKVLSVGCVENVKSSHLGKQFKKQDCMIADTSACGRVVVWEEAVGTLVIDKSYTFKKVTIRQYNNVKYLSIGSECEIISVDDIGEVAELDSDNEETSVLPHVLEGEIDGTWCSEYVACTSCDTKIESKDGVLAECHSCGMTMKFAKCPKRLTAKVRVTDSSGQSTDITMFHDIIMTIVDDESQSDLDMSAVKTTQRLLLAPPMRFRINKKNIVVSVEKI